MFIGQALLLQKCAAVMRLMSNTVSSNVTTQYTYKYWASLVALYELIVLCFTIPRLVSWLSYKFYANGPTSTVRTRSY